jgi:hypothetical protein
MPIFINLDNVLTVAREGDLTTVIMVGGEKVYIDTMPETLIGAVTPAGPVQDVHFACQCAVLAPRLIPSAPPPPGLLRRAPSDSFLQLSLDATRSSDGSTQMRPGREHMWLGGRCPLVASILRRADVDSQHLGLDLPQGHETGV